MTTNKEICLSRLIEIVDLSYKILIQKLGHGGVKAWNEASFQLEFGHILKTIGNLYEFGAEDKFHLEFESSLLLTEPFVKSGSHKARIDIFMTYTSHGETIKSAIELKFFKKENHREPNNRYDVFRDLHNLEIYKRNGLDVCFFILGTDHTHYYNKENYSDDTSDFNFSNGKQYNKGTVLSYKTAKPYGPDIWLQNDYHFKWDCIQQLYFLKILVS